MLQQRNRDGGWRACICRGHLAGIGRLGAGVRLGPMGAAPTVVSRDVHPGRLPGLGSVLGGASRADAGHEAAFAKCLGAVGQVEQRGAVGGHDDGATAHEPL